MSSDLPEPGPPWTKRRSAAGRGPTLPALVPGSKPVDAWCDDVVRVALLGVEHGDPGRQRARRRLCWSRTEHGLWSAGVFICRHDFRRLLPFLIISKSRSTVALSCTAWIPAWIEPFGSMKGRTRGSGS